MSILDNISRSDLQYSGPSVWPKLSADETVDLFIFRRPELAYLKAVREVRRAEVDSQWKSTSISIGIRRMRKEHKRKVPMGSTSFVHTMDEDPLDDVRRFLVGLRNSLVRFMPRDPDPETLVFLVFRNESGKQIVKYQDRWV